MADVDALLEALTLEEKACLTAGEDFFSTVAIDRLGLPKIRLTDGPAGAKLLSSADVGSDALSQLWGLRVGPATCIPSGSAIGATWDPQLAQRLGALVGKEVLDRGSRVLLAPTLNLHRSPLAGRNFECFSEDPLLAGRLAVGYVRGVQSKGVLATVKHFVGNDAELERDSMSSVIDERTLRELYLLPFELAIREGDALALMTAYNRLNGYWLTEQPQFLLELLREEWGFNGIVMTDWNGVVNAATSLAAGLDLEMPGPGQTLGRKVLDSIESGLVDKSDLDTAVRRLLSGLNRIGALDGPPLPVAPQPPSDADIDLIRFAAAEASVLLTNDGLLPLDPRAHRTLAVIGDAARLATPGGGGSAQVMPHRATVPLHALQEALGGDLVIAYERGCDLYRAPARVGGAAMPAPDGFTAEIFEGTEFAGPVVQTKHLDDLFLIFNSRFATGYPDGAWSLRARGTLVPETTERYRFVLVNSSPTRVFLDGSLILDGTAHPPASPITTLLGIENEDLCAEVDLTAGSAAQVVVEYVHPGGPLGVFRLGVRAADEDILLERAVVAAREADVSVVFVGTNDEWESEGRDRTSFSLPGRQDELVRRVAAVNPQTVVVVNSGGPVDLPWADDVAAVLQVWFGGQEMDRAIADVLTGHAEPGGRLPVTIPRCLNHNPSFDNFPGENGEVRYGEGLFMGYRGYEHRAIEPRFAFGHGLSYTTFDLGKPQLSTTTFRPGDRISIRVPVTNNGSREGSQVVQCYVAPRSPRLARPLKELKGFAKVHLTVGETGYAEIVLDDRSFAYWDSGAPDWESIRSRVQSPVNIPASAADAKQGWRIDPGEYDVHIGSSSSRIDFTVTIDCTAG